MTDRLGGKVALISGAGSGIGRAAAQLFATEGAAVAVLDLRAEAADETVAKIVADGGRAVALVANVASAHEVEAAMAAAVSTLGRLDVVTTTPVWTAKGSVANATEDDWDRAFAVNAKGTFLDPALRSPHLIAAGGGSIINQGSVAALVGSSQLRRALRSPRAPWSPSLGRWQSTLHNTQIRA